jgi:glucose/arabinose dehydrogenase/plastocyanin
VRTRLLVTLALLAGSATFAMPSAAAASQTVTAHSTAGYLSPALVIEEGDSLDFTNADPLGIPHNVYEDGVPEAQARFRSATVPGGVTTPVEGVEALAAGTYTFLCTLHPWMKGALEVVADGTLPIEPPPIGPPGEGGSAPVVALPGGVVPTPTAIHATDTHLYVASYAQGAVVRLPFLTAGVLGAPETVATGFTNPLGVAVAPDGTVFVADSHPGGAAYGGRTVGRVQAVRDGAAEVVVDGLPNGRHNTNNLAVAGGRLLVTNGNSTDDGVSGGDAELPLSGTLLSVALDARGIVVGSDGTAVAGLTVEATGMRNLYDVAVRPGTDEAWITTNGPDTFDPYGEDTLVKVPALAGAAPDFGFPECLYDAAGDILDNPASPGACGPHAPPEQLLGLHVSANGLAFGPDDATWGGDLFIAEFGNFYGSSIVGHRVVRVPVNPDGTSGPPADFLLGAAPLDVAFGPAGLYIADFAGAITLWPQPPA